MFKLLEQVLFIFRGAVGIFWQNILCQRINATLLAENNTRGNKTTQLKVNSPLVDVRLLAGNVSKKVFP